MEEMEMPKGVLSPFARRPFFNKERLNELIREQKKTGETLGTLKVKGRRYIHAGVYSPRVIKKIATEIESWGFHVIRRDRYLFVTPK